VPASAATRGAPMYLIFNGLQQLNFPKSVRVLRNLCILPVVFALTCCQVHVSGAGYPCGLGSGFAGRQAGVMGFPVRRV
jgi:hypothetical protein